jgi:ABC-type bacteriocin/lantibiotic exporter with double-glycine peptidase domain
MSPRLTFSGRQRTPVILQTEAAECGLACLAMVAGHYSHRTDLATLRGRHSVSLKGTTLAGLIKIAAALNLSSRPLRLELEALGFTSRMSSLIDAAIDFKMLELFTKRVADIALTPPEVELAGVDAPLAPRRWDIEVRHLGVRYAESEPFVLQDISLQVRERRVGGRGRALGVREDELAESDTGAGACR